MFTKANLGQQQVGACHARGISVLCHFVWHLKSILLSTVCFQWPYLRHSNMEEAISKIYIILPSARLSKKCSHALKWCCA